ncbi:MAG: DUF4960 domain-containing protein [Muribaculaceae bacterium]|nr:DUF4960 domain-containing protein [Muribaculaceae bacterium]
MKTSYKYTTGLVLCLLLLLVTAACSHDNTSDLKLDGFTTLDYLKLSDYEAVIDHKTKQASVGVPIDEDVTRLTVTSVKVAEGAKADLKEGDIVDCSVPRNIRVTNGDVFTNYTLTVKHDDVQVLSASLDNVYSAAVDNEARTIRFFVPLSQDLSNVIIFYTLNAGATGEPASGSTVNLTEPIEITMSYRTAVVKYTVSAVREDMSQAPKAFIGNGASVEELGPEAAAAARWMLENVSNSRFVSLSSLLDGSVKLSDFKMVWCHLDWTDWPGIMWDTRDLFNDYYIKGGNILASRDGARYINDVWRIARDQQSPNNMFGGDNYEILESDLGLNVTGHENHPLYSGLPIETDGRILLMSAGCANSNRTLQWVADWDAYGSVEIWQERTGATALGSGNDFDPNRITTAEFAPREVLSGYMSGCVITIGTPAYEWYVPTGENLYKENIQKLTKNAINYLCQ